MYLLDTMVLSELRKSRPDRGAQAWLQKQPDEALFLSVMSLGEIERGIERQRALDPGFAAELQHWAETLCTQFSDRLLPVTAQIARRWGRLSARVGHDGADLVIAATALCHGLTVVTRNTRHFKPSGALVLDPFG